jgi:hydrogenase expression/formation protein HypE
MNDKITLNEGSGGEEMNSLINMMRTILTKPKDWIESDNDSALFKIDDDKYLAFTTDSYIVDPIFFPGGDIGKISICGTINDLLMIGAKPIGLSLGMIIEEGFDKEDLKKILNSIEEMCKISNINIVTGDTKVMEKNKIDKIIINTAGIGLLNKENILTKQPNENDKIIISGSIGDHAIALLSKRFEYETNLITDSKPLVKEFKSIKGLIKVAKDPTRGGIASALNDITKRYNIGINIYEEKIPLKKEVKAVSKMLGLDPYQLACEGRFISIVSEENSQKVLSILKEFEVTAEIIGEITKDHNKVILKTELGDRIINNPSGRIVPRIC